MRNTTTIQSGYHLIFRHLFSVCLVCLSVLLLCMLAHAAGINTDGSLGPATTLTPGGPKGNDYTIPSNLGQQKGSNLFHSFGNFNVDTGYTATFTGPDGTTNVIGRVTGGNSSWIDGRLGCDITGANLWLLNPFGILFGSNASLNVNGSFHASTADYLQLSDGGVFYTDLSKTSKLTIAAPSAFGFLSSHPKEITISGSNLEVPEGESISIIGGDICIENGHLVAPGGRVNLASLGSPGTVEIVSDGLKVEASNGLGNINISNAEGAVSIDVSGVDSKDISISGSVSGSVNIYCKTFSLYNSHIISDNRSNLYKGGDIRLVAEESASIDNYSRIGCDTYGEKAGGDIDVHTGYLALTNYGRISASTSGIGGGGSIMIHAKDIWVDGGVKTSLMGGMSLVSQIDTLAYGSSSGNSGNITIDSESLTLTNGGRLMANANGSGGSGNITISAKNILVDGAFGSWMGIPLNSMISSSPAMDSSGSSGSIIIDSESLMLTNGGELIAGTYGSSGSGNITISAKNILVDGGFEGEQLFVSSGISCQASKYSTGNGGSLNINTESFKVTNGGEISAATLGSGDGGNVIIKAKNVLIDGCFESTKGDVSSKITCQAESTGNAGNLNIDTESLKVTNGGTISAHTSGSGDGGDVTIKAKDVLIDGVFKSISSDVERSMITCQAESAGNGGSLNINTESLKVTNGGVISAATFGSGDGGDVTIKAKDVLIDGGFENAKGHHSSLITCQTESAGNAGNLNIDTESLSLTNSGQISASTFGSGDAGNVTIKARDISIDGGFGSGESNLSSMITCQTQSAGNAGNLNIDTESLSLTNSGQISAFTFGSGDAGNVTIKAKDISIDGGFDSSYGFYPSIINCKSRSVSSGKAGNISFQADTLSMSNRGEISVATYGEKAGGSIDINVANLTMNSSAVISSASTGTGYAGSIMIAAKDSMLLNDAAITVEANSASAGDIKIQTPNLDMKNTSQITASVSGGSGSGGSIDLNVDTLSITEGSRIESNTAGSGSGGNITVAAGTSVTISGKTEEASGMYGTSTGAGSAGSITVKAPTLNISDAGEISSSASGTGHGGSIDITVANLIMNFGAVISSASTGTGDAGNINLTIVDKLESRNSTITTESTQADGGDITITNTGFLTWLINSSITATVGGGPQTTGGNIRINSPYIVLKDSHVIANAYEGKGGNIGITADTYLADWTSMVSASSTLGISGLVDINSPLVNLSGLLSPLPTVFVDITELLADDCETRYKHRRVSSLVVRGRDALPVQPGDLWPSPVMMR